MKMIRIINLVFVGMLVSATTPVWATDQSAEEKTGQDASVQESPKQQSGTWETAGHEVKEATGAVVEAARESAGTAWEALKSGSFEVFEKSKGAWHTTKQESLELWEQGKTRIHEATAPEEPTVPPPATPPPAKAPENPHPPEGASMQQ
jgi:hypothetical protein